MSSADATGRASRRSRAEIVFSARQVDSRSVVGGVARRVAAMDVHTTERESPGLAPLLSRGRPGGVDSRADGGMY